MVQVYLEQQDSWYRDDVSGYVKGWAFHKGNLLKGKSLLDYLARAFLSGDEHFKQTLQALNGFFSIILTTNEEVILISDKLKSYPLLYFQEDGKFFARSSRSVLDALLNSLGQNIDIRLGCKFKKALKNGDIFEIYAGGEVFKCKNLVCSLGALSHKNMGASSAAFDLAESFGHEIVPPYPALCGVVFTGDLKNRFADTAGISLKAELTCGKNKFLGGLLFTHDGISGPALFNLSLYGIKNKTLEINFCPQIKAEDFIKQNKNGPKHLLSLIERLIPPRLAKAILNGFDKKTADLTKEEISQAAKQINDFSFTVEKLTGYEKAEITAGGISTKEISSKTMMSQKTKSLYFTGECLDISGQLGGYNLAWAWASACAAAKAINEN